MKVALKLTLALVAGIVVVQIGSAFVRIRREQDLFLDDISHDTRVLGRTLGYAVERTWQSRGEEDALEIIEYATAQEANVNIRLVWVGASGLSSGPIAPLERLAPLHRGQSVVLDLTETEHSIYTYVPLDLPTNRLAAIEIADPQVDEEQYLFRSVLTESVTAFILVVLCGMLSWLIGYVFIGRPVKRLVEQAKIIGRGELGRRIESRSRDELGLVAAEIDSMSVSLEKAREQLEEETRNRIAALEHLRHADRLSTIGTLAAGIAHQLGTPINVIEGQAQLIREDERAETAILKRSLVISRQCARMSRIISRLLDFARRGGRWESSAAVDKVVDETLEMFAPLLRNRHVDLLVEEGGQDHTTSIAPNDLQQIFCNLIVNAVQAMPNGGHLLVRIDKRNARKPGSAELERDYVTLEVQDTGQGMDEQTLHRIFEPFFTTKDVGDGTGLGLSVAYGIVEDHAGWIDVASTPDQGSTFTVYLPAEVAR